MVKLKPIGLCEELSPADLEQAVAALKTAETVATATSLELQSSTPELSSRAALAWRYSPPHWSSLPGSTSLEVQSSILELSSEMHWHGGTVLQTGAVLRPALAWRSSYTSEQP
ncbi:unnamed protein product [Boreogadus saida]